MRTLYSSSFFHQKTRSNNLYPLKTIIFQNTQNQFTAGLTKHISKKNFFPPVNLSTQSQKSSHIHTISQYTTIQSDSNYQTESDELNAFYQTQAEGNNFHCINNKRSKAEMKNFFYKYNIKQSPVNFYAISLNKKADNTQVTIPSSSIYFKSVPKAFKTLELNEQIVKKMNQINNHLQLDSYIANINNVTAYENKLSKMPKVRIKKIQHPRGNNDDEPIECKSPRKRFYISKIHGMMPFLKISRDIFVKNSIQLEICVLDNIKIGPKPTSRSLFTLNSFGNECFLFGGMNANYKSDMWIFRFSSREWQQIFNNEEPLSRCNHTAVVINESLLIFGGLHPLNIIKAPEDLLVFNLYTKRYTTPIVHNTKKAKKRKAHIAVSVGQTMLIHGGYDEDDIMLNTAYILTLPRYSWGELSIKDSELPYLAYHCAAVVSDFDYKIMEGEKYSIYKPPSELIKNTTTLTIKYKGIYMFGGHKQNMEVSSDMYVITIGKFPCEVFKLKTKGIGPTARQNSHMIYNNHLNCLVIHGGDNKVDLMNDLFILDTETLNWKKTTKGEGLQIRTAHKMVYIEGKILILGGREESMYHKMDFTSVEFDIAAEEY